MKKIFTLITVAIIALSASISVQASPADPTPYKYIQPDGSVITLHSHGDEFYSWITDDAGNEVEVCDDGYVRKVARPLSAQEKREASQNSPMRTSSSLAPQYAQTSGSPHFLILLIQFSDKKFIEGNTDEQVRLAFDDMMNKTGYNVNSAVGSVQDYFNDNSNGQFIPVFDVYGPVTVSGKLADYGATLNSKNHDSGVARALIEACYKEKDNIDFSKYDDNNDHIVDNIFFFFAGNSEAENTSVSTNIWPHKWNAYWSLNSGNYQNENIPGTTIKYKDATEHCTSGTTPALNGYMLDVYGCTSEFTGRTSVQCGIGTFCHEFSHTLGLDDFYDTDYEDNGEGDGLFHYSLMSSGNYNGHDSGTNTDGHIPPSYTSIDKVEMGWSSWTSLSSGSDYTLSETNKMTAYRTILSSSGSDEYFVYEARNGQKWDSPLPTGLLIYHVRESQFNSSGNKLESNPGIYFKAAYPSSLNPPHASEANVPYPGPNNITSFDNNSPSPATDWSGKWYGDALSDIQYNSTKHEVTFTYTKKDPNARSLSGTVSDYSTGAGISGAEVLLEYTGGSKKTTTGTNGSYSFDLSEVTKTEFTVSISKTEYLSIEDDTFTYPGGDYIKNFKLISESTATEGIELKKYKGISYLSIWKTGTSNNYTACIKFTAAEMKPFAGMSITEISFAVHGNVSSESAVVWFGSQQALDQEVNNPIGGQFMNVPINNGGLTIPKDQDVYVGYSIEGATETYPLFVDNSSPNDNGFYWRNGTNWSNLSEKGSLLISFKVEAQSSPDEKDEMYTLGYSGLNLEQGKEYAKNATISLSLAESSDDVMSVTYYYDGTKKDGSSINTGETAGDHTIKAEVTYKSGKTETIIQIIKVQ